ncbi:hypothetical protein F4802DRAFT_577056 [Xylaria palmicola]|nr:hypothetical protein F4802DRAFT_577056 [Xylaria palmicola]
MANSLAALKSLPCPAGDNCAAFQCLFGHARDKNGSGENAINNKTLNNLSAGLGIPTVPAASRPRPSDDHEDIPEQDLHRKRIKLDVHSNVASLQPSSPRAGIPQIQAGKQSTTLNKLKDSSPRTLTRKPRPVTEKDTSTVSQQSMAAVSTAPANLLPKSQAPQPKQPNKGPESLNPRLLKKAPAKHPTRVALVKALHKEFQRLNDELRKAAQGAEKTWLLSDQELIVRTLDEEQEIATKKTAIYNTSIRNKILTYKRMTLAQWKEERSKAARGPDSDNLELASTTAPTLVETGLTPAQEIQFLPRLVHELAPLEGYGYVSKIPSEDDITSTKAGVKACGNTEVCDRCTKYFQVFPGRREVDGALASGGPCVYHPGKSYITDRTKGERRFKCCQRSSTDEAGGCTTSEHHVFKTTAPNRLAAVLNFANTPTNPGVPKDRAVSFDCEMGYTVYGLELIRMTVVSWPAGDTLLDILVRPFGEVLDLNTRYSGVRPEDMALAEQCAVGSDHRPTIIPTNEAADKVERRLKIAASPKVARDLLFSVISAETPVIGHGLENDLNAARIIHPTCIDTVLLFPHKQGLPRRNGLKHLMERELGRKIQVDPTEGAPEGHDSAEDAQAAGELVRLKMRDEWKTMQMKGWTVSAAGELQPPGEDWTIVGGAKVKKR